MKLDTVRRDETMKRTDFLHSQARFLVRRGALLGLVCAWAASVRADTLYVIDVPALQIACTNTASALGTPLGQWLTNSFASLSLSAGGVQGKVTPDGRGYGASLTAAYPTNNLLGQRSFRLKNCQYGFAAVRSQPDYFLGEKVATPGFDIDWAATSATNSVLFGKRVFVSTQLGSEGLYFADGGTFVVNWVVKDGSVKQQAYLVSSVSSKRPYRLFWTDFPYSAPPVSLKSKFVQFYGVTNGLVPQYVDTLALATNINQNASQTYYETSSGFLYAKGTARGQFVMAYFDSGLFERLLDVIVVEVASPTVKVLSGDVGDELHPEGEGFDPKGLEGVPTLAIENADGYGDYLYRHLGQETYSPKNGSVFSIRPTRVPDTGDYQQWKSEVYWREVDSQNVSWPFQRAHYKCDWPTNDMTKYVLFVRGTSSGELGTPVFLPEAYTAQRMPYQEPAGHALAVAADK